MTIAGWACPYCNNKQAPLDHYATTDCGLKLHPAFAAAVLYDEANDPHGEAMSVTDGLGCPRLRAIENQADVYVDPLAYNAMMGGRAWDLVVGRPDTTNYRVDKSGLIQFWTKVQVKGTIAGMEVTGEIDNVRRLKDKLILSDWKHSNNLRAYWISRDGGPSAEYKIQTSIYAELYRQMYNEMPTHGEVVYHFSGSGGPYAGGELKSKFSSPALMPFQYAIWPIEECLAYKPYGGQYTVRELYEMAQTVYGPVPERQLAAKDWRELPLVGQTMSFGSKEYCDYCQARDLCFTQARGAPF